MAKHIPSPELIDDDNPEWVAADFARARPAAEVLPALFGAQQSAQMLVPKRRGRPAGVTKVSTTVRFDAEVLARFKASGPGWQTRMDVALKDWLKTHDPRDVA
jgi:uncharacterized protein (DUF4415 family)